MRENAERKPARSEGEQANGAASVTQLMRAMGSEKGFDPMPPDQYLTYQDQRYSPAQRVWAWMLSKTIRHGHRSKHAVDEQGKALTLQHAELQLEMDGGNVRKAWRELEAEGRVRRDGRNLCICGSFKLPVQANKKRSEVNTDLFSPYYMKQIKRLPQERQAELFARYEEQRKLESKLLAEAVAGVRSIFDQRKDTVLLDFGIKKIREKKRRPAESPLVPFLLPIVEGFVQTSSERSVQTSGAGLYTGEIDSVQTPASILNKRSTERTAAVGETPRATPPLSMAAAAGSTSTPTTKREPFRYPLTLAKGRGMFPTIDIPFVMSLATIAKERRPSITDEELASCLVKKHGQTSEGLFFKTVGPRVEALNEYDAQQAADRRDAEARRHQLDREAREDTRRLLRDPKLHPDDRALLLRDNPELAEEFAGAAK